MTEILKFIFKTFVCVVIIYGLFTLFEAHHKFSQEVTLGKAKPITYHNDPLEYLYCNNILIGSGNIWYENMIVKNKTASNSQGIWHIDNKIYKQKEGELCERRDT